MVKALSVEVIGLDKLLRKIDVSRLDGHIKPMFQRILLKVEGESRRGAPRDTGALGRSIRNDLTGQGLNLEGRVFSNLIYAPIMEFGRRPGTMPPPAALEGWARRKGLNAFAVARSIAKFGIPSPRSRLKLHFMRDALRNSEQAITGFVRDTARGIEQGFER